MAIRKNDSDQSLDQSRPGGASGASENDRVNQEDDLDTRTVSNDVEEGDEDYDDEEVEDDDELDEEDFDDADEDVDDDTEEDKAV